MNLGEKRRKSYRTEEEFKEHIAEGVRVERDIIERYSIYYKNAKGEDLVIVDNGCDNTGSYLDFNKVNLEPDFVVNGRLVEIKYLKNRMPWEFRLRVPQFKSYIKKNALIILVNGYYEENTEFTIITPSKLKWIFKNRFIDISKDWEGRNTVFVYKDDFKWYKLPNKEM